jgi:thiol:disulfide interchange protein DsbD
MKNLTVKILFAVALLFSGWNAQAQIVDPVKWKTSVISLPNNEAEIEIKATIDPGFHLYSTQPSTDPNVYALPTELILTPDKANYELIGKLTEGKYITHYDEMQGGEVNYFENSAVFKQKIKIIGTSAFTLKGLIQGQTCNDKACYPLESKIKVQITPGATEGAVGVTATGDSIVGEEDQVQLEPTTTKFRYWIQTIRNDKDKLTTRIENGSVSAQTSQDGNMWQLFFLGFLGGLVALLTPCVFPMIPLTVAFFTKGNKDRKKGIFQALIYGGFIFLIYILLSMPFHFLDQINENILNDISTNVPLNIVFFVIFIVFALSFFGLFEITLPAGLANKMDKNAEAGGLLGSFFMALTLAIVSFSCTGPILGSLLAGSLAKDGGAIQLTVGMGGFGLALGIPFALFAMFPGMLLSH